VTGAQIAVERRDKEPLLCVRGLDAWYGPAQALYAVSLDVAAGEAVVLLGRNGAGKSTTMKAIMGLEVERRGSVRYAGAPIEDMPTHRIAQLGLGYVPEDRRVFAGLTVTENLRVGRQPARDGHAWTPTELFHLFPNLGRMQDRLGGHMSGGEQQMLTIARTLMGNPRCILLDEPSEGLAPVILEGIAEAILTLKRRGVGFLISEQNLHFAKLIADRAVILETGQVRFSGAIADFDRDPELATNYLAV
jgi:branched-chain amino acid transport system ATP-binding protein